MRPVRLVNPLTTTHTRQDRKRSAAASATATTPAAAELAATGEQVAGARPRRAAPQEVGRTDHRHDRLG